MTYDELVEWCGSERMAYFLAGQVRYSTMNKNNCRMPLFACSFA